MKILKGPYYAEDFANYTLSTQFHVNKWLSNKPFTNTISQQNRISFIHYVSLSVGLDWNKIQTRQKVTTVDCKNSNSPTLHVHSWYTAGALQFNPIHRTSFLMVDGPVLILPT